MEFFKPEDSTDIDWDNQPKITIRQANRILREKLEKAWTYYGNKLAIEGLDCWHTTKEPGDTHSARLVCIEEIKK